jgi:hypothetical protein
MPAVWPNFIAWRNVVKLIVSKVHIPEINISNENNAEQCTTNLKLVSEEMLSPCSLLEIKRITEQISHRACFVGLFRV